jgi:glycosyltransferase involved in cell wall biosynthesis
MMTPAISVVMGVYNGMPFLDEAVKSILRQTFTDFECIAINDGSQDESGAVLDAYAATDSRLRVVHQENRGLVATLNRGIHEARAPLIARMDADDIAHPERFARQIAYLHAHPEIAVLGSAITVIDASGAALREIPYPMGAENIAKKMRHEGSYVAHPAVMMRREAVLAVGGYREAFRHAEDYDLWLRLLDRCSIDNLPESLLYYRQHGNNTSFKHRFAQDFATKIARYCAAARQQGKIDPINAWGEHRPIDARVLDCLNMTPDEEASLRITVFKYLYALGAEAFASEHRGSLESYAQWLWLHRRARPAKKLVRKVFYPLAYAYNRTGDTTEARKWLRRCWRISPWQTLLLFKRPPKQDRLTDI